MGRAVGAEPEAWEWMGLRPLAGPMPAWASSQGSTPRVLAWQRFPGNLGWRGSMAARNPPGLPDCPGRNTIMRNYFKLTTGAVCLAGLALAQFPACGQDVEALNTADQPSTGTGAPTGRMPVFIGTGVSEQFKTDIDGGGQFSLSRARVDLGVPLRLNDVTVVMSRFRYEFDSYDFSGGYAPWHNINEFSVDSLVLWRMDSNWTIYGGPSLKLAAESDANLGNGFTGGGAGGVSYKYSDTLSFGAGLAVTSQLEDHALVSPLITANWKFADEWRLKVGLLDLSTIGYAGSVAWIPTKLWEVEFGAQYHRSRFRIDGADASANGVGQEEATILFTAATCHLTDQIDLVGFVGLAAGGSLQLSTSGGTQIRQSNYDPAPLIGLRINVRL